MNSIERIKTAEILGAEAPVGKSAGPTGERVASFFQILKKTVRVKNSPAVRHRLILDFPVDLSHLCPQAFQLFGIKRVIRSCNVRIPERSALPIRCAFEVCPR